jgi:hypothetical protein
VATTLLLTAGCLDYEETLILNADGSGQVRIHFLMDKSTLNEMQAYTRQMGDTTETDDAGWSCSEAEIRATLGSLGSNLELLHFASKDTEDTLEYELEFSFKSQADFRDLQQACPDEEMEDAEDNWEYTFAKQADGSWSFMRAFQAEGPGALGEEETSDPSAYGDMGEYMPEGAAADSVGEQMDLEALAEAMQTLGDAMKGYEPTAETPDQTVEVDFSQMMTGLSESMQKMAEDAANHHVRFEIHFPGRVVQSNATEVQGRVAVWQFTLDKVQQAPDYLEARIEP